MCWLMYESVKLNQYNRVRVINIISKVSLNNIFHIKGTENPADIGTRMKNITVDDIHPGSDYLCGKNWMKLPKDAAIKKGVIKPIKDIKLGHEDKKVMKKGVVFDSFEPEESDTIAVLVPVRVNIDKVAEREAEAGYLFSPLTRNFNILCKCHSHSSEVRQETKKKARRHNCSSSGEISKILIA